MCQKKLKIPHDEGAKLCEEISCILMEQNHCDDLIVHSAQPTHDKNERDFQSLLQRKKWKRIVFQCAETPLSSQSAIVIGISVLFPRPVN